MQKEQKKFDSFLSGTLNFSLELVKTVAIVFTLAFVIRYLLIQPFVIEGSSMEPNFHNRQLIIIDKLSYRLREPSRSDVVVFESPQNMNVYFIKRIIGLPGDSIRITQGEVYINGNKLNEPYLKPDQKTSIEGSDLGTLEKTLSQNEFFVMGDNRDQSSDSREWGILPRKNIVGRFWFVIYPRNSWYSSLPTFEKLALKDL